MQFIDFSPPAQPSLDAQRDALQKGLGRAMQWAVKGQLGDEALLEACLHDKRLDQQCEQSRGGWLWGLLTATGGVARCRTEIFDALRQLANERDAHQLCELAFHYAKSGDRDFEELLYRIVEQRPFADFPNLGEDRLLELGNEHAFRFIVRIRGRLLESREWDWDDCAVVENSIERFGEESVNRLLDDPHDAAIRAFGTRWNENRPQRTQAPRQTHVERMRAITAADISKAAGGTDPYWFGSWGRHCDERELQTVLHELWATPDPVIIAKLLRILLNRAMPVFDPRLPELCRHENDDIRQRALAALSSNAHPSIREFALQRFAGQNVDHWVLKLLIRNFERGDEERILDAVDPALDPCELHSYLTDALAVLEKNSDADCSRLGVAIYGLTPCENCRFRAARLLIDRQTAPEWMLEELRFDSNENE